MDRRRFLHASLLAALGACAREPGEPVSAPTVRPTATGAERPPPAARPAPSPAASASEVERPEPSTPPTGAGGAASAATLGVLCRDAWGASPPGEGFVEHTIRQLTVHHSAVVLGDNRNAPGRFRQHQQHHQSQGWPDIAYHLGVDRRGNVYDLRPARFRGDTFTSYDPSGHFLVLAEGNFDQEHPSDDQLEGVALALAWGAGAFGAPAATLSGHRDHAQTSCPGDALYAAIPDLRARVEELTTAGVERTERCGPEAAAAVQRIESGQA